MSVTVILVGGYKTCYKIHHRGVGIQLEQGWPRLESRKKHAYGMMPVPGMFELEIDEFEDALRVAGLSEKAIKKEIKAFKEIKNERRQRRVSMQDRISARRSRKVKDEALSPYVEAEIRRLGGVTASELLDEMNKE